MAERRSRDWPGLGLVAAGGSLGAGLRAWIEQLHPASGWPWATFAINLTGAFLLGLLLEALARRAPRHATRLRLLAGTGVLGGFTTYSTLAVETAHLAGQSLTLAVLYSAGSVLAGIALAACGIAAARAISRREAGR